MSLAWIVKTFDSPVSNKYNNIDFAKEVFLDIISKACKHGSVNCKTCSGRSAFTRHYYKHSDRILKKRKEKYHLLHPDAKYNAPYKKRKNNNQLTEIKVA